MPEGPSDSTRAWIARRDAAQAAAEAVKARQAPHQQQAERSIAAERGRSNPVLFLAGIVLAAVAIIAFGLYFLDRVQCDPMIWSRGMSAQCKGQQG